MGQRQPTPSTFTHPPAVPLNLVSLSPANKCTPPYTPSKSFPFDKRSSSSPSLPCSRSNNAMHRVLPLELHENPGFLSASSLDSCEFPRAVALLCGHYLQPEEQISGTFRLPSTWVAVLNDYEQASLIFAGQSHNGLTAHAEALEKRYQEVLQAAIDLKLDWERANASTRDVRHNLELCLGLVFEKLAAAKAIGSTSSSSLRPGYMVPQLQIESE